MGSKLYRHVFVMKEFLSFESRPFSKVDKNTFERVALALCPAPENVPIPLNCVSFINCYNALTNSVDQVLRVSSKHRHAFVFRHEVKGWEGGGREGVNLRINE